MRDQETLEQISYRIARETLMALTPNEQARADAIADAETLRINAGVNDYSLVFQCWIGSPSTLALNRCTMNAYMAIRGAHDFAYERGVLAASDAFAAVPGLRGEDTSGRR